MISRQISVMLLTANIVLNPMLLMGSDCSRGAGCPPDAQAKQMIPKALQKISPNLRAAAQMAIQGQEIGNQALILQHLASLPPNQQAQTVGTLTSLAKLGPVTLNAVLHVANTIPQSQHQVAAQKFLAASPAQQKMIVANVNTIIQNPNTPINQLQAQLSKAFTPIGIHPNMPTMPAQGMQTGTKAKTAKAQKAAQPHAAKTQHQSHAHK